MCVCGRRGCWERYASGAGLVWLSQQRGLHFDGSGNAVTGEALVELAHSGDVVALDVWAEFSEWLARGLANLADVLDPELFVIGVWNTGMMRTACRLENHMMLPSMNGSRCNLYSATLWQTYRRYNNFNSS